MGIVYDIFPIVKALGDLFASKKLSFVRYT